MRHLPAVSRSRVAVPGGAPGVALHRRGWFVTLLCLQLLASTSGCTRLKVNSTPYSDPSASAQAGSEPAGNRHPDAVADPAAVGEPSHDGLAPAAPTGPVVEYAPPPALLPADAAGVTFTAYEWFGDQRRQEVYSDGVLAQLWIHRAGRLELVHRSDEPAWTRLDLIPGEYELEVVEVYHGERVTRPNQDNRVAFTVQAGTTSQVNLVIKQVPWGTIAIVSLAVVLVVVLVALAVAGAKLDPPKGTPRGSSSSGGSRGSVRVPPPPRVGSPRLGRGWVRGPRVFVPLDIFVADLDPVVAWSEAYEWMPGQPRVVRIVVPASSHPGGMVRIEFDRPMEPFYFDHETFRLASIDGRTVPGGIFYEVSGNQVCYHPLRPLAPGTYVVTLYGEMLQSVEGPAVAANMEQRFTIGP